MRTRTFGRTGAAISELGYGAWGISRVEWIGADDERSLRSLHLAVERGVTFFDTALAYGDGHSEELVGQLLREVRDPLFVATKVPPLNRRWPAAGGIPAEQVFPGEYVEQCTEQSLRNLGVEALDLQQLHVWSAEWIGQGDWVETVERLKQAGKIRAFGVSLNDHEPDAALPLIETGVVDTVQVIYNVFDQSPEERLFPAAQAAGVGVIARVPFDEGALTGRIAPDTEFPPGDFRTAYFGGGRKQEVWDRVNAIARDLDVPLERLPELALRFCISHPAVSTVIPGMRSPEHVEANVAAVARGPLPDDELAVLRRHRWERSFYA
jgi:aryl-alcohol dehydrogenase-like predicted oxidoreductase